MVRTQIQLTPEQARALKKLSSKEGKPVAELIRLSIDALLSSKGIVDPDEQRKRAMDAAGKLLGGPPDLSIEHDRYLAEAFEE